MDKILKGLGKKWHSDDYGVSKEDVCMARNREAKAAADIIYRLTAERDAARRDLCDLYVKGQPSSSNMTDKDYAAELGWDCFKEDGK